ncbi:MAG: hypothetical protein ABIN36_19195 [Ferruginibacter sp.]
MRAASLKDIKTELDSQPQHVLLGLCLRLAKFKKENKELLTYLLFEESNEASYVNSVKTAIDLAFLELNIKSFYIAKKNLRKILRSINRYIKYSNVKTTEASLLIYFCSKVKASGLQVERSTALSNIYSSQVKKIKAAIATLHEDLQYDYTKELDEIL